MSSVGFAVSAQKVQDWLTQQWVIIRGRKIDPNEQSWLIGPFGRVGGIGEGFVKQLAEREGLEIQRDCKSCGLISSILSLNLTDTELARLSRQVIDFYENTSKYDLQISVAWTPLFRAFAVLTNKLFSNRINQLNIPLRNMDESHSLKSEVIRLVDPRSNETRHTIWFRTIASTGQVVYSGVYGICESPSGQTLIKAVFPLPNGNATVLMVPRVGPSGELVLESAGQKFGDAGFYFLLQDSKGELWAQFIRSFRDRLTVRAENDHLIAEQTLTLFVYRVATFSYRIVLKIA